MRAVEVLQNIVATIGEIDAARIACHGGAAVDLAGLDARVRELCLSTSSLPHAEGLACAGALDGVSHALDRLRAALLVATQVAAANSAPANGRRP
jgi:hypothetical protein